MAWDTPANVISDAAIELGIATAAIANPYASTDPAILQLCAFLKSLGQDLWRDYQWSQLQATHTFSTASGTADYALPADFGRLIDQTEWNRTQQMPLRGPADSQTWQMFQARSSSGVVFKWFRISGDRVYIFPTPTAIETVAFEYVSRYWVDTGGGSTPDAEAPTTSADSLFFDRRLLVTGIKYLFRSGKGMESSAAFAEFDGALRRARGNDGAAPVLSLSSRPHRFNEVVLPETGFGD